MPNIKLAEIVKLIQIIDNGSLEISGKRQVILGFENIKNSLVKAINQTFETHDIDEKNIQDFEFTLTKKESNNE